MSFSKTGCTSFDTKTGTVPFSITVNARCMRPVPGNAAPGPSGRKTWTAACGKKKSQPGAPEQEKGGCIPPGRSRKSLPRKRTCPDVKKITLCEAEEKLLLQNHLP